MSPVSRFSRIALLFVGFALVLSLAPRLGVAAPLVQVNSRAWYSLQYDALLPYNPSDAEANLTTLSAIGLDQQGNGWIAVLMGSQGASYSTMLRISGDKVSASDVKIAAVEITDLALSDDGSSGWAVGFDTNYSQPGSMVLLQYAGGKWQQVAAPKLPSLGRPRYQLALDSQARNGWAVGVDGNFSDTLGAYLKLTDGKWASADSELPAGVRFDLIAASPDLKYAWATGPDHTNDGTSESFDTTFYYLKEGKWTKAAKVGFAQFADLAIDASGNGWAVMPGYDEPAAYRNVPGPIRLHADGTWEDVPNDAFTDYTVLFKSVALGRDGKGWMLGNTFTTPETEGPIAILQLDGDKITPYQYLEDGKLWGSNPQWPLRAQPLAAVAGPNGAAWAISYESKLLSYTTLNANLPALAPQAIFPAADLTKQTCFTATGYCLRDPFRAYWQANGGLRQFGLAISPELIERLDDGKEYVVQYTERARLEYHPESKDKKYQVQLGLLGNKLAEGRGDEQPFQPAPPMVNPAATYFSQTKHNLSGPIGDYWQKHGGLPAFGYPLTEAFQEKSATDGKTYLVQYFERNRLEYHPESKDPTYQVLLGLLGMQQYQRTYGNPPPLRIERGVSPISTP